jgi:lantibiotic biosynthesis protein
VFPLEELCECESTTGVRRRWPTRTAWCYGGPGVAFALWLAGRALGRADLCKLAVRGMLAAVMRPIKQRLIPSPTFCHGAAGFLQIALRFYSVTGQAEFRQTAIELVDEIIRAYEPASILGYRSVEREGRRVDNPGLLDGAPGVVLALLATSCPVAPSWDRLFLLS